jgi:hypothetical protein
MVDDGLIGWMRRREKKERWRRVGGGDFINDKTSGFRNLVENGNGLVEWKM